MQFLFVQKNSCRKFLQSERYARTLGTIIYMCYVRQQFSLHLMYAVQGPRLMTGPTKLACFVQGICEDSFLCTQVINRAIARHWSQCFNKGTCPCQAPHVETLAPMTFLVQPLFNPSSIHLLTSFSHLNFDTGVAPSQ